MTRFLVLTGDGRIGLTSEQECCEGMQQMDFPEGFDFEHQMEWRVIDGTLVHDPAELEGNSGDQEEDALIELAALAADNAARLDEQDAALVELAYMITGGV